MRTRSTFAVLATVLLVLAATPSLAADRADADHRLSIGSVRTLHPDRPLSKLVSRTAHQKLGRSPRAQHRVDLVVAQRRSPGRIHVEARAVVSEKATANIRHIVRSVATVRTADGHGGGLQRRAVVGAVHRALNDALALLGSKPGVGSHGF